ncbi:hypothetical protein EDC94DRAFT_584632 [Helicostylum pulchrum]|nr:hypothetical protein EDC94DRAFT_584632 [Helicostylum pulchrum]
MSNMLLQVDKACYNFFGLIIKSIFFKIELMGIASLLGLSSDASVGAICLVVTRAVPSRRDYSVVLLRCSLSENIIQKTFFFHNPLTLSCVVCEAYSCSFIFTYSTLFFFSNTSPGFKRCCQKNGLIEK